MLSKNDLEKIKEIIKEFFEKMTIDVEIEFLAPQEVSFSNVKAAPSFEGGEPRPAGRAASSWRASPSETGREEKIYTLPINIKTTAPQILIGEGGQTLIEIQQLLKIILKKKIGQSFFVDLDINGYKKKKIEYLKEMAKSIADEVSLTKKEKWLPSMPAYERRIIHLELAERKDVTTESIGKEPERKVVIRPYP